MKVFIPILLFIFANSAFGQRLPRGKFVHSTMWVSTELALKANSKFNYSYRTCTGELKGFGTYIFKDSVLVLMFESREGDQTPKRMSVQRQDTVGNVSYFKFNFYDQKDGGAVPAVSISYHNKLDQKEHGTLSDSNGLARISIENTLLPIEINVRYIGTNSHKIRIDTNGTYLIKYPLLFGYSQILGKGDILEFVVDEYDYSRLNLKLTGEAGLLRLRRKNSL